jgi:hypothetical protein
MRAGRDLPNGYWGIPGRLPESLRATSSFRNLSRTGRRRLARSGRVAIPARGQRTFLPVSRRRPKTLTRQRVAPRPRPHQKSSPQPPMRRTVPVRSPLRLHLARKCEPGVARPRLPARQRIAATLLRPVGSGHEPNARKDLGLAQRNRRRKFSSQSPRFVPRPNGGSCSPENAPTLRRASSRGWASVFRRDTRQVRPPEEKRPTTSAMNDSPVREASGCRRRD